MAEQTSENIKKLIAQLEALLFIYGEPLSYKKIVQILKTKEDEVRTAVKELEIALMQSDRGLSLVSDQEKVQLVTKADFKNIAEEIIKEELNENLTLAALETLSIIIYSGPISRAELDYIRGVNSSFILRNLLIRGLVERSPDPKRTNAFIYNPSFEFLKHLGISKREDLPEYQKFQDLIKALRTDESQTPQQPA